MARPQARSERIERFLSFYHREPMLLPPLIALLAHVALAFSPLIIDSVRDRSAPAMCGLLLFLALSVALVRYALVRRLRAWVVMVVATWAAAAVIAWAAHHYGVY